MKKKYFIGILILILLLIVVLFILLVQKDKSYTKNLMQLEEYQELKLEDIKTINIMKYTESGVESVLEENKSDIKSTFNTLSKIKVGEETKSSCDDNTTIYIIEREEKDPISIEIECNILVLNKKRYLIKK